MKKSRLPNHPKNRSLKLKILLVDDDSLIRESVARSLNISGYDVITAENGAEALMLYESEQPQISLIDINLPDLDGFSILKALRKKYPTAEIIFITGEGDMNLVIKALRDGASDFVPKPLTLNILLTVLENATRRLSHSPSIGLSSSTTQKQKLSLSEPPFQISAFGGLSMMLDGKRFQEKDWQNFKTAAVFKILLINHKKVVTIDDIIDQIWKDTAYRSAEVMVFTAVSFIRRLFEPNLKNGRNSKFLFNHELGYELNLGDFGKDYFYDVEAFEIAIKEARAEKNIERYQKALELYSDDFLKNNLSDDWSSYAREALRDSYLAGLQFVTEELYKEKKYSEVTEYARKMLSADSLYEPAYSFLIQSYLALRRPTEARRMLQQCQTTFKKMLDAPAPSHITNLLK